MPTKHTYKRRTVEIYFVLYLSALLFILPDRKQDTVQSPDDRFVAELPFNIFPEKTNLNARLTFDSLGTEVVALDSVNNIFYSGDVNNVNYEFVVYDAFMKQKFRVNNDIASKHYRIVRNDKNKSVAFYWKPSENERENKSYIVQVVATAEPKNGSQAGIIYQAKTQFSLNLLINTDVIPSDTINANEEISQFERYTKLMDSIRRIESQRFTVGRAEFDLAPERELIRQVAYQKWVNVINVYNVNLLKDLKNKPQIIVSGSANQRYHDVNSEIYRDKIVLSGSTPPSGKINIKVVVDRRNDSRQKSISFSVMPLGIEAPSFDRKMYVGKTYTIDPQMPMLDRDTKVVLRCDDKILSSNSQGTKFRFTPSSDLIGKTLQLDRYIDNSIIPEENKIVISDYPGPEIISMRSVRSGEAIEVKVKSYGFSGSDKNLVVSFEISGNASYRELYGNLEAGKDGFYSIQTFVFSRKKSDRKFEFDAIAVDKSGKKSKSRTYSAE